MDTKVVADELKTIEADILLNMNKKNHKTQRDLVESTGYSLGAINKAVKSLKEKGYLDGSLSIGLTDKAHKTINDSSPKNAIILAAGLGLRMIPINNSVSKGLLEVKGEYLIERIIKQLYEVGVEDITIVVGFMKEKYEYLIDKYNVRLIVNKDYAVKNNIYSLKLVSCLISNTYIIPCDIWCKYNPFSKDELYSWYMISDELTSKSYVRLNRKNQLVNVEKDSFGNRMLGISYLTDNDARVLRQRIEELTQSAANDNLFWDDALNLNNKFFIQAKLVARDDFFEINTYEQLRTLDSESNQLQSNEIKILSDIFEVESNKITDISALKKGMTNRSFLFNVGNDRYIMRIPGEGTDKLINRKQEASVYKELHDKKICDDIIYINEENGYKVSRYFENARCCDSNDLSDVAKCMDYLRRFHEFNLKVEHEFDLFGQIEFYEKLRGNIPSLYRDYYATKEMVLKLKRFIDSLDIKKSLTHIDAVFDNFLFVNNGLEEEIRLIDWEYAGMQDVHVDIAMFVIYACYDEEMIDKTIDFYFENNCSEHVRYKIYAYIAIAGLLWSNWCEYKYSLGVEFGEYSIQQYRYAKIYSKKVINYLEKINEQS